MKIVPVEQENVNLFGKMKGTVHELADITQPIDEEWEPVVKNLQQHKVKH